MPDAAVVIVKVAIAIPLRTVFDYLLPADIDLPQAGMRVEVPFGNRVRVGVVLALCDHSDVNPQRLRSLLSLLDSEVLLNTECLGLLQWASDYFHYPIGEVIFSSLPSSLRNGAAAIVSPQRSQRYCLTTAGGSVEQTQLRRAPRQYELLQRIKEHPQGLLPYGAKW